MFLTVKYQKGDQLGQEARVIDIHQSSDEAVKLVDADAEHRTDMFAWSGRAAPRPGDRVQIEGGQIVANRRPPLVELMERVFKRQELRDLARKNSALQEQNSQLAKQLEPERTVYHGRLERTSALNQSRYWWIASSQDRASENMVSDFAKCQFPSLLERIMLAPDRAAAARLNRLAQENRLAEPAFDGAKALAHEQNLFHKGDRVRFCRDAVDPGVRDGDLGEVIMLDAGTRTLVVALDRKEVELAELVFVPLAEYGDVDLGYAAAYDQAPKLQLQQAFVLGQQDANTPELVAALSAHCVEIHLDRFTAQTQFPEVAGKPLWAEPLDLEANPLAQYMEKER
ncbi:hypothetical protein OAS39_02155 [Pirellulales bacterium]|nr:hypothetical protein [Pirellulales bacterium]